MIIGKKKIDIDKHIERRFGTETLGDLIKTERLCWKIKQKDLAKNLKITQKELSEIERGIVLPSLEFAALVAKKLGQHPVFYQNVLLAQIKREKPNKRVKFSISTKHLLLLLSKHKTTSSGV